MALCNLRIITFSLTSVVILILFVCILDISVWWCVWIEQKQRENKWKLKGTWFGCEHFCCCCCCFLYFSHISSVDACVCFISPFTTGRCYPYRWNVHSTNCTKREIVWSLTIYKHSSMRDRKKNNKIFYTQYMHAEWYSIVCVCVCVNIRLGILCTCMY